MMELAPSITAFGNTNPTSYFRLVPHQEAPSQCLLGRSQPFCIGACTVGLGCQDRYVYFGKSIGKRKSF